MFGSTNERRFGGRLEHPVFDATAEARTCCLALPVRSAMRSHPTVTVRERTRKEDRHV